MPPKGKKKSSNRFPPYGRHAKEFARFFKSKYVKALSKQLFTSPDEFAVLDCVSWAKFCEEKPDVVEECAKEFPSTNARDPQQRVRENFNKCQKRVVHWLKEPNGSGIPADFLEETGLIKIGGGTRKSFVAGGDDDKYCDADKESSDEDDEEDFLPFADDEPSPVKEPPKKTKVNEDLEDELDCIDRAAQDFTAVLDQAVQDIESIDLGPDNMRVTTARCMNIRLRGAAKTDINHVHVLIAQVAAGVELSSLHAYVEADRKTWVIEAKQAPEMAIGQDMIPYQKWLAKNQTIATGVKSALQSVMNTLDTDNDENTPRPKVGETGKFFERVREEHRAGALNPYMLYLPIQRPGDDMIIHKVCLGDAEGCVPAYNVIWFFLEEQDFGQSPKHRRKINHTFPGEDSDNHGGGTPDNFTSNKRSNNGTPKQDQNPFDCFPST